MKNPAGLPWWHSLEGRMERWYPATQSSWGRGQGGTQILRKPMFVPCTSDSLLKEANRSNSIAAACCSIELQATWQRHFKDTFLGQESMPPPAPVDAADLISASRWFSDSPSSKPVPVSYQAYQETICKYSFAFYICQLILPRKRPVVT